MILLKLADHRINVSIGQILILAAADRFQTGRCVCVCVSVVFLY